MKKYTHDELFKQNKTLKLSIESHSKYKHINAYNNKWRNLIQSTIYNVLDEEYKNECSFCGRHVKIKYIIKEHQEHKEPYNLLCATCDVLEKI